jgi:hypothetical protein
LKKLWVKTLILNVLLEQKEKKIEDLINSIKEFEKNINEKIVSLDYKVQYSMSKGKGCSFFTRLFVSFIFLAISFLVYNLIINFTDSIFQDYGIFVNPLKSLISKDQLLQYGKYLIFGFAFISLILLWISYYLDFDCALHLCGNRLNFIGVILQLILFILIGFIIYKSGNPITYKVF